MHTMMYRHTYYDRRTQGDARFLRYVWQAVAVSRRNLPRVSGDVELFCPECEADIEADDISCSYCGALLFSDADKRQAQKRDREIRDEKLNELVCVKTVIGRVEGEMLTSLLASFGIWSLLKADDCAGMRPHMAYGFPDQIYVRRADVDRALEVLNEA